MFLFPGRSLATGVGDRDEAHKRIEVEPAAKRQFTVVLTLGAVFLALPVYKDFLVIGTDWLLYFIEAARAALFLLVMASLFFLYKAKREDLFALLVKFILVAALSLDLVVVYSRPSEDMNGLFISVLFILTGYILPFADSSFSVSVLVSYSLALSAMVLVRKESGSFAKSDILLAVAGINAIGLWLLSRRRSAPAKAQELPSPKLQPNQSYAELIKSSVDTLPLSDREKEVACHILAGESRALIANRMTVSEETIKKHTANIYSKMGVSSKAELFEMVLGDRKSAV